jgi:hypothetical protein
MRRGPGCRAARPARGPQPRRGAERLQGGLLRTAAVTAAPEEQEQEKQRERPREEQEEQEQLPAVLEMQMEVEVEMEVEVKVAAPAGTSYRRPRRFS